MFSRSTYALVAALFASIALFGSLATASAGAGRRLAQPDLVNEELARHCRDLGDGHHTQEGPHTDIERRDRTPAHADRATDPRERLDAAGIAPRTSVR